MAPFITESIMVQMTARRHCLSPIEFARFCDFVIRFEHMAMGTLFLFSPDQRKVDRCHSVGRQPAYCGFSSHAEPTIDQHLKG